MRAQEQNIIQTVPSQGSLRLEKPSLTLLLEYGGSAVAIILSISILLLTVAQIIRVLVPVMLQATKQGTNKETNTS